MYVTRILRYIMLYITSGIIRGRSWNVLPVDTGGRLYVISLDKALRTSLSLSLF
jgi:hypothetical protein